MSDKELEEYSKKIRAFSKEITKSESSKTKFLVEMGVITKKGNVTKRYKHVLCTPHGQG